MLGCEDRIDDECGSVAAYHVDVGRFDVLRVQQAHDPRDHAAPVTALGDVLGVAELEHELVACFGVLGEAEAFPLGAGGEAEVGDGGRDDVEGGSVFVAGGKEGEEFGHFEKAAGPWSLCQK